MVQDDSRGMDQAADHMGVVKGSLLQNMFVVVECEVWNAKSLCYYPNNSRVGRHQLDHHVRLSDGSDW